ncbi:MAG: M20/M25/M40 family metallo-hydrolase [Phycisphaerae bacterium]
MLLSVILVTALGALGDEGKTATLADRYAPVAGQIIEATLKDNDAHRKLEELCYHIGHRLSGSKGLEQAVQWAARTMQADGLENVRAEPVMVPKWVRGPESLTLLEPRRETLAMLGLGGSVGTGPEGITGVVVAVADEEAFQALGEGARGKIVLFNNPMPPYHPETGSGYGKTVRFRSKGARLASEHGAIACLVRSVTATSLRSPHTGAMRYGKAKVKIPAAAVSTEDAEMLARLFARGTPAKVTLKMAAKNHGQVESANVVGELRGSELPEEVVVISGHLDSWDVGQGAHDDGGGCVMAMEAIHVLRKLNLRPRRTIRVVLWTNEENGLGGAKAYVKDHADEMSKHVAAIEADSGTFAPRGFSVDHQDQAKLSLAADQLRQILGLLGATGATDLKTGFSGADVSQMKPHGVALLGFSVEGSRYFDYHHTQADTFDKVDPEDLSRCVASIAVAAYVLADMPNRLGEP